MGDINKNINNWNLPEHQPDPGLWERIEKELDKPVNGSVDYKKMMTILPVHNPPPDTWNHIADKLDEKPVYPLFTQLKKFVIPLIIILLLGVVIFYFVPFREKEVSDGNSYRPKSKSVELQKELQDRDNKTKGNEPELSVGKIDEKIESLIDNRVKKNKTSDIGISGSKTEIKRNNDYTLPVNTRDIPVLDTGKPVDYEAVKEVTAIGIRNIALPETGNMKSIIPVSRFTDVKLYDADFNGKSDLLLRNFYTGIHYVSEFIYHKNGDLQIHRAKGFGIDLGYKFPALFFESGLELSFTSDNGTYEVDYLQNEIINTYIKVDSIIYDTTGQNLSKEYVTSDVNVYDSVEHNENRQTVNRYSYLRIPLLLGYKFDYRKVSLFIKAGTEFSLLVRGDEPVPVINGNEIRIVNVDRLSPDRVSTNWQMIISAGMGIRVTRSIYFTFEPQYRYYLNSYYSQQMKNYKKPYSIGIRAGLLLNF